MHTHKGALLTIGLLAYSSIGAENIPVPNGSFESPTPPTGFPVNTSVDSWQESPQPVWFNPADFGGVTWDQLSGVFPNPPPESTANHIDNMHGSQAAYLFAVPQVALFQDYASTDWSHSTPTHAFDAKYTPGMSYQLTVGVLGGSGMTDGAGLQIGLYYRDGSDNFADVGKVDLAYSLAAFPTTTHFQDYTVSIPTVQAADAWAGKNIGVRIMATGMGGTYWDVDNVRVTAVPEPGSLSLLALGLGGCWLATRLRTRG
jgi:hypothetical protein